MNRVDICYTKSTGELTLVSRSDQGNLKVLNTFNRMFVLADKEDMKDLVPITSFVVKTKKDKRILENDLMSEISMITPEMLDVLKSQAIDEFILGTPVSSTITNEFKRSVTDEAERAMKDFMSGNEESKTYETSFNTLVITK